MFPPASPMTERIRVQNEQRELERRAARHTTAAPRKLRLNLWLPRLPLAALFGAVRGALGPVQPQPPARDCQ